MYWHIDADIVSLIVMAALYVYNRRMLLADARLLQNQRFLQCIRAGIFITIIDIAASVIMDVPINRFLFHLLMTMYLLAIELVIVEWYFYTVAILYQQDEKRRRLAVRIALYGYAAYALLAVTNPWTGLFFTFGADHVYARGPGFFLMVLVFAIYAVALFAMIIVRRRQIPEGYPGVVLLLVPVILSVFIAAQLLVPGWLMIMPGYMVCLVLTYLFLQNVRVQKNRALVRHLSKAALTDQLTGILNRAGMEYRVQQSMETDFGKTCFVTVADLDGLKMINDTMGHSAGDLAIQAVAEQLERQPLGVASRFGGDEFVTYCAGGIDEALAHRSLRQLQEKLAALRLGDAQFSVKCSIGAVFGTVGTDSFETLCNRADAALYHVKRCGRNGFAFYRPEMENELQEGETHATMSGS